MPKDLNRGSLTLVFLVLQDAPEPEVAGGTIIEPVVLFQGKVSQHLFVFKVILFLGYNGGW